MQLTSEWYFWTSALDKKTCNKIKSLGKNDFIEAQVNKKAGQEKDDKFRVSDVSWINEQWVVDLIWPYMVEANKQSGWNFDVTAVESMQITKYKPGGFYTWHRDGPSDCLSAYEIPKNKSLDGKVRKLSMTILLNGNYQGGELQFARYRKFDCNAHTPDFKNAGSVIVFPSFIEHQVTPVTKGTRYSLVAWFVGPPFK